MFLFCVFNSFISHWRISCRGRFLQYEFLTDFLMSQLQHFVNMFFNEHWTKTRFSLKLSLICSHLWLILITNMTQANYLCKRMYGTLSSRSDLGEGKKFIKSWKYFKMFSRTTAKYIVSKCGLYFILILRIEWVDSVPCVLL